MFGTFLIIIIAFFFLYAWCLPTLFPHCQACNVVFSSSVSVHWLDVPLAQSLAGTQTAHLLRTALGNFWAWWFKVLSSRAKKSQWQSQCRLCAKAHSRNQVPPFMGWDSSPLKMCPQRTSGWDGSKSILTEQRKSQWLVKNIVNVTVRRLGRREKSSEDSNFGKGKLAHG